MQFEVQTRRLISEGHREDAASKKSTEKSLDKRWTATDGHAVIGVYNKQRWERMRMCLVRTHESKSIRELDKAEKRRSYASDEKHRGDLRNWEV